jgi:hypothetical protein
MVHDDEVQRGKEISFYEVTLNAWYSTKFEKDKHLLSISSAGIGLLVTLATTTGVANVYSAIVYGMAVLSFLGSILCLLGILGRNASYLESVITGKDDSDPLLKPLDRAANSLFILGIIFTLLVGVFSGINKFHYEEEKMSETEKKVVENYQDMKKSLDGAAALRPQRPAEQQPVANENTQPTPSNQKK